VWHCPICAPKIAAERRHELDAALTVWSAAGGDVLLATFTHSHHKDGMPLAEQDAAMRKAFSQFTGSRVYRAAMADAGYVGAIRASEVTHGELNGWHPHIHALWFVRPGQIDRLRRLRNAWARRLIKSGLAGLNGNETPAERFGQLRNLLRRCLDVRDGKYAAEYVAKFGIEPATDYGRWGLGSEVTRGHTKRGHRLQGRTPFALLKMFIEGDARAGRLFREYAEHYHGKRQLYWSPKLRDTMLAAVDVGTLDLLERERMRAILRRERDDEAIAAAADRLHFSDWQRILETDTRGDVLEIAAAHGADAVRAFIDGLKDMPRTHGGHYSDDLSLTRPVRRAA
jgi:hypothetical protein